MNAAEHIAGLHALMRTEYQDEVAELQGWAQGAKAQGDEVGARWYRERIERLEAIPKPWE
ncbi:MAG: hypothetical protein ACRDPW_10845 [Mycobacteriales bacterium]